jgi:hypothetical protein
MKLLSGISSLEKGAGILLRALWVHAFLIEAV